MSEINVNLTNEVAQLQNQVQNMTMALKAKENIIAQREAQLRQGGMQNNGPEDIANNLRKVLPGFLVPGNIGDINRVIWQFQFPTEFVEIGPNQNIRTGFTVTQESGFVLMDYVKTVYLRTFGPDNAVYIDPSTQPYDDWGLKFVYSDPQSNRSFFNLPLQFQHLGDPRFPSVLPTPRLLLPNSTFEATITNEDAAKTFIVAITARGYRVRLDNANNIISTVYA